MNDLPFVRFVVEALRARSLDVWLFGGWAEELRGLRAPGAHADIDLLLVAKSFEALEAVVVKLPGVDPIPEKRFSHKRAFEWGGIRVEVFLVKPDAPPTTSMFDGLVELRWPVDTFTGKPVEALPISSESALALYRREHARVEAAYRVFQGARERAR